MKTKTIAVYSFKELKDEVKNKVIEQFRDLNVDGDYWFQDTIVQWEEKLEKQGFGSASIEFSGFSSQGDGACFTSTGIEIGKLAIACGFSKEEVKHFQELEKEDHLTAEIKSLASNYSHERTKRFSISEYDCDDMTAKDEQDILKLERLSEEMRLADCKAIYRDLEKEYQWNTSDEAVIGTIEANDYEFLSSGKIFTA